VPIEVQPWIRHLGEGRGSRLSILFFGLSCELSHGGALSRLLLDECEEMRSANAAVGWMLSAIVLVWMLISMAP